MKRTMKIFLRKNVLSNRICNMEKVIIKHKLYLVLIFFLILSKNLYNNEVQTCVCVLNYFHNMRMINIFSLRLNQ